MACLCLRWLALVTAAALIVASGDGLVLCPTFPRCCTTRSCWFLCPSCSEARFFISGMRIEPKNPEPCPDALSLVVPDPYAFPEEERFPDDDFCLEYNTYVLPKVPRPLTGVR